MQSAPRSLRLHIGIFGRRNVGKSSLLNAITRQQVSIVSATAGTTTDPVEKPMELLPLGPVLFVDTAGVDDEGALGELRVERTRAVLDRVDLGILVAEAGAWGAFEERLLDELAGRGRAGHRRLQQVGSRSRHDPGLLTTGSQHVSTVSVSALTGAGLTDLREAILRLAPPDFFDNRRLVADLVPPGEVAVLVVPIDKEAPKGRLILPQVMAIRDLLDGESMALVVQERELRNALARLAKPPALVVTDSQAFLKVAADVPRGVPMTSFSILMSRFQGDLRRAGARHARHRAAEGRRPRARGGVVQPSPDRRGHRPREDPALADAVRRRAARVLARPGSRLPGGPLRLPARGSLRQLHGQPARDAVADPCDAARPACRSPTTG